jgi:hypothetical protein
MPWRSTPIMNRLQIMQLNVGKRRAVQHGLLNDEGIKDFDAIAVLEPYIFRHPQTDEPTVPTDNRWQIFKPTQTRQDGHARHAFRAAIWVNKRCKAKLIQADSYDITAVLLELSEGSVLVMACYEPRNGEG